MDDNGVVNNFDIAPFEEALTNPTQYLIDYPTMTEAERVLSEPLKEISVELTYLANDIGSLGRDRAGKNYVTLSCPAPNEPGKTGCVSTNVKLLRPSLAVTGVTGFALCPATDQPFGTVKVMSEVARSAA